VEDFRAVRQAPMRTRDCRPFNARHTRRGRAPLDDDRLGIEQKEVVAEKSGKPEAVKSG